MRATPTNIGWKSFVPISSGTPTTKRSAAAVRELPKKVVIIQAASEHWPKRISSPVPRRTFQMSVNA